MASTSLKVSFYDIPIQVWSTRPLLRLASEILNKESSMQGPGRWLDLSENVMPTTAPAITLLVRSHIEDNSFFSIALLSLYTSPWVLRWNFISSSPATSLILCLCKQHVQRASPPAAVSTKQTFYSGWKVDILCENLRQGLLPIATSAYLHVRSGCAHPLFSKQNEPVCCHCKLPTNRMRRAIDDLISPRIHLAQIV